MILSDASNNYTGGNTLTAGTLSVGVDADLGALANAVTFNGGALATTGTFTSSRTVTRGRRRAFPSGGTTLTLSGTLSGTGALALTGRGRCC